MTPTDDDDELRRRVAAAYDDVLREPVPQHLSRLLAAGPAPVVDLAAERARRANAVSAPPAWTWVHWGGMAASLAIGVIAGVLFMENRSESALVQVQGGQLVAASALARSLDAQLAGDPAARVAVQLSFVDRSGRYCRTFSADALAGLACREGARWNVVATAHAESRPGGGMRQAASALPRPVLDAVDARIAGNVLDAPQERAARERGWRK